MRAKLLTGLLALGILCSFGQGLQPPQRFEHGILYQSTSPLKTIIKPLETNKGIKATAMPKRNNKAKEDQPSHNVDFVLDFNVEKLRALQFVLISQDNYINSVNIGLWMLNCGSNIASVPEGIYDMLFVFNQTDTLDADRVQLCVIRENVTIDHDMQLMISASEAKNRIHFETLSPEGEPLTIGTYFVDEDNNLSLVESGNIDDCICRNTILSEDYGGINGFVSNFGVKTTGEYESKGDVALSDIFVNDVSDRISFYSYRTAYRGHEVFNTAFETVGCSGDKTLTNDPSNYTEYDMHFKAPHHQGEELLPELYPFDIQNKSKNWLLWGAELDPITDEEALKFYFDAKLEDSPVNGFIPFIEVPICKEITNQWGYPERVQVISSTLLTKVEGEVIFANNGTRSHFSTTEPNFSHDYSGLVGEDGIDAITYPLFPTHPAFSYPVDKAKGVIGNNCPILVCDQYQLPGSNPQLRFIIDYLGRYGEKSEGQAEALINIKLNGEAIDWLTDVHGSFYAYLEQLFSGVVDATVSNELVEVDDLPGSSKAQLHYTAGAEDETPPTMTMLHFKDSNGDVTDRFATSDAGKLEFTAGDFNFFLTPMEAFVHLRFAPETVEVSYSPYGEDNWNELSVEEVPENYWPTMGWFYTAPLASVTGEAYEGWFDLKIRLEDAAGNWQEQVISPAFCIDNLAYSSIATPRGDNIREVARYNLAGQRVDSNATGVVIVKMSDGTARKVIL